MRGAALPARPRRESIQDVLDGSTTVGYVARELRQRPVGRRSLQTLAFPSAVERSVVHLAPDPSPAGALQRAGAVLEVAHAGPDASAPVAPPSRGAP